MSISSLSISSFLFLTILACIKAWRRKVGGTLERWNDNLPTALPVLVVAFRFRLLRHNSVGLFLPACYGQVPRFRSDLALVLIARIFSLISEDIFWSYSALPDMAFLDTLLTIKHTEPTREQFQHAYLCGGFSFSNPDFLASWVQWNWLLSSLSNGRICPKSDRSVDAQGFKKPQRRAWRLCSLRITSHYPEPPVRTSFRWSYLTVICCSHVSHFIFILFT